jgi:tRNA 2-thiouridine synthesizing protein D
MANKKLTFALMDGPFESARSTTALRLIGIAAQRGYDINVFAYEGAVYLPFKGQQKHGNAFHGADADAENHPLPREWIAELRRVAEAQGGSLTWMNCGLCADERGANEAIEGVVRGGPPALVQWAAESDNVLVIPTR